MAIAQSYMFPATINIDLNDNYGNVRHTGRRGEAQR